MLGLVHKEGMPFPAPPTGDPRTRKNYRPRGPKRFSYTYEDIARLSGLSLRTVKAYAAGKRRLYDPTDLGSVVAFLVQHKGDAPGSAPCQNGSSTPS